MARSGNFIGYYNGVGAIQNHQLIEDLLNLSRDFTPKSMELCHGLGDEQLLDVEASAAMKGM